MPGNQRVNAYLKEISDLCGITRKMTFHTARPHFANIITFTNGVSIAVGKMFGHRNLKQSADFIFIRSDNEDFYLQSIDFDSDGKIKLDYDLGDFWSLLVWLTTYSIAP